MHIKEKKQVFSAPGDCPVVLVPRAANASAIGAQHTYIVLLDSFCALCRDISMVSPDWVSPDCGVPRLRLRRSELSQTPLLRFSLITIRNVAVFFYFVAPFIEIIPAWTELIANLLQFGLKPLVQLLL